MFEKILIFVVFLGPLIFFHELGHFLFARFFGVRVEVFSIGFGPKFFKKIHNGTEYALSVIPLGGYVKMFGDDPFSEVQLTDEEKSVAFNYKTKWQRFWIVFGGPLANLLLAFVIYFSLTTIGEKVPETKVGFISEQTKVYELGFRSGDVLVGINDEKISSFDDLNLKSSTVETVIVKRGDQQIHLKVNLGLEAFLKTFMEALNPLKKSIFVNSKGQRFYFSLVQSPQMMSSSLEELTASFKGEGFLYKINSDSTIDISSEQRLTGDPTQKLTDTLMRLGYYPVDLMIRNIVMSSPADKAGLKKDDIITGLNGQRLYGFEELRSTLQKLNKNEVVELKFLSGETEKTVKVTPEIKLVNKQEIKLLGVESSAEFLEPTLVEMRESNILAAFSQSVVRTWDGMVKTFLGYKKLISREVSLNNIGGPLAIGKVASDSLNISLSMFFRLMAIISINLGVINLFPIPVLDGGHIMFLAFEAINRGPLSRKKLELAQKFGISILFFLIFVALFNDVTRLF